MANSKIQIEEALIGLVRERPFLYDLSHVDYRNVKVKELAWVKIAELIKNDYSGE